PVDGDLIDGSRGTYGARSARGRAVTAPTFVSGAYPALDYHNQVLQEHRCCVYMGWHPGDVGGTHQAQEQSWPSRYVQRSGFHLADSSELGKENCDDRPAASHPDALAVARIGKLTQQHSNSRIPCWGRRSAGTSIRQSQNRTRQAYYFGRS